MAEFWPEKPTEPSSAKVVKPSSSSVNIVAASSEPKGDDPPTVLSSFKPASAITQEPPSMIARELAGEMLAHFRLDDYIGVGGMGAVFRATDIRLDRPVALKILPPEQAKDPEIVARFQHEARAAARLDHENIARVYFVAEERGLHFIAFEFVEGVNVRELIGQCGPLPPHEVVNYGLQITGALIHAVLRSVVHRDIKPSNIIITPNGRAKLVDMGLARNFERRHDGGITQSGITLGTFDYISPEQARDPRTADVRSDIYSLGCTLFHMLTGRPPYPEGTLLQKLLKHQEEAPPDPRAHNPRVPAELANAIMRMMAKEPAQRYQTPQELLSEFLEIAAGMGLRSSSPEGLIWVSEQPRSAMTRATWAIWLTAAATLVLSVVGLSLWPGQKNLSSSVSLQAKQNDSGVDENPIAKSLQVSHILEDKTSTETGSDATANIGTGQPDHAQVIDTAQRSETIANESSGFDIEPGLIAVGRDQDLRSILDKAPSGSIIEISGEYRPQSRHLVDDSAGIQIEGKRLTIKAAPGSRPRIILSYDDHDFGVSDWTLFNLIGSQVEFEGIHFEIGSDRPSNPRMVVLALQSSQVTMSRCSFLQGSSQGMIEPLRREGEPQMCVAHLNSSIGNGGQVLASKLTARECFFGGGDGAFCLDGPVKLDLSDCMLLPYRSPILLKSVGYPNSLSAEVRLTNVSVFGSGNPIVDMVFANASVYSQAVVYSHESSISGVLARVDADSRLLWRGQNNLYHGVRQFLVSRIGAVPLAQRLSDWIELSRDVEERDSAETEESPWLITMSEAATKGPEQVADAFRLAHGSKDSDWRPIGARFVLPWGPLYAVALDVKKLMNTTQPREASAPTPDASAPGNRSTTESAGNSPQPTNSIVVDLQSDKTFQSLGAACARAEEGAVIEIRHSGTLPEGVIELGNKHLTIRGAAGFRPTVEFSPSGSDLRSQPRIFDIRQGSLTLRDLDIRMVVDPATSAEVWCVIVSRSADIQMEGCTVTVQGSPSQGSSVVRLLPGDVDDPMIASTGDTGTARPQFQLRNVMAVGIGSLVKIQPAVRCRVEIENCAVEVQDSMLAVAGGMDRSQFAAVSELDIRRSTIKTGRSLVSYEANESRAWLPRLEISAADNLFVGDGGSAWLRFKSPRATDELRGLLRWKGMNNSYDGVDIFWELESMASGETERFSWDQWLKSPARDEIKAERGKMDFVAASDSTQPWMRTRNHFKPGPSRMISEMASDGGSRGADLSLIPAPPQERQTQEKPVER